MNVITVQRTYRLRKKPEQQRPGVYRAEDEFERREDRWQSILEVLLFGIIAIVSAWPLFAAGQAVLHCL
jgi:hypothetical protein